MAKGLSVVTASVMLLITGGVVRAQIYAPVYQDSASTVGESYARGMANVIQSAGTANLNNSAAAINYTQARSMELDNRLKSTNTYFEMRAANKAYREAERGPRPTAADLARYAKLGAPQPLSPSELDPLTGAIRWPVILMEDNFEAARKELDQAFEQRAKDGYLRLDGIQAATAATDQMLADMRANISEYPPQLYSSTRRFLDSVRREITAPTN